MTPDDVAWYCVRSQPKHEHVAAASLRLLPGIEVFNPRLRFRRATRRGPVWVTEPLFPSYLFARFALEPLLERVRHAHGVHTVVHFGWRCPTVPDKAIAELQAGLGGHELHELSTDPQPGDEVRVVEGPFGGLTALVHQYRPATQRVRVLLEFLGRTTSVELSLHQIVLAEHHPPGLKADEERRR